VAMILAAMIPLGIAFAAIRQASRLDGAGYLATLFIQVVFTVGTIAQRV